MDWWKKAFNKDYIAKYQWQEKLTERQVDFVLQHVPQNKVLAILDVACGYGRHANLLGTHGHTVLGLDQSMDMLKHAAKHSTGHVMFERHDMRDPLPASGFDVVVNLFTSFGYFSDEDNRKSLANMAAALKRGGVLILDFVNPEVPYFKGEVKNKRWQFNKHGVVGDIMLYSENEFRGLFEAVGLGSVESYGDYDSSPYDEETSHRLIMVGKKK